VLDKLCLKLGLLRKRKQTKLQWLQNPHQMNEDHLDNVRREASRTFRKELNVIAER
jgi:hypothetical protein